MEEALGQYAEAKKEEILGTETVNGYKCTKKRIETTVSFFGFEKTVETILWVSDRFDMPLRTQNSDGTVAEMRNIREGKQAAELFEPPTGYRKVASMMELFGAPQVRSEDGKASGKETEKAEGGSPFQSPSWTSCLRTSSFPSETRTKGESPSAGPHERNGP